MNILAIDLGTQSIRSAIVSKHGEILAINQIQNEFNSPFLGWAQQKPQVWWELTKHSILELLKNSKIDPSSIEGISTCGQIHGSVGIDNQGKITELAQRIADIGKIVIKEKYSGTVKIRE